VIGPRSVPGVEIGSACRAAYACAGSCRPELHRVPSWQPSNDLPEGAPQQAMAPRVAFHS